MYEELVKSLRNCADAACNGCKNELVQIGCRGKLQREAADAIEELQRICDAMKPKHDAVCVKCACYAEAEHNDKGFLICPASGMDITAWDFCSYFEPVSPPDHIGDGNEMVEPPKEEP